VSGYHTPFVNRPVVAGAVVGWMRRVGAWTLEYGRLPDGRYAIDYLNAYNGQRTRHYFETAAAALAEYRSFGRSAEL
jgi:hypothetical protein